jgi:hypothetical protein
MGFPIAVRGGPTERCMRSLTSKEKVLKFRLLHLDAL